MSVPAGLNADGLPLGLQVLGRRYDEASLYRVGGVLEAGRQLYRNTGPAGRRCKMSQLVTGRTGDWEVVIGLEVHAQVSSKAKLFSGASASFGAAPNEHVSLVDAAMPGMLPVINRECVYQAIRTGLG
jgi:hypothetical protein